MQKLRWFTSSLGINNYIDPRRIAYDENTGVQELAAGVNIVHDSTGRLSRRLGYEITDFTSSCHSCYGDDTIGLFVSGNYLYLLKEDGAYKQLTVLYDTGEMFYCRVNDTVYFNNGTDKGYIKDEVVHSWERPNTIYGRDSKRVYLPIPGGKFLSYYKGKIFIISGRVVYQSDSYGLNIFDGVRGRIIADSDITIFQPVKNGIWLGTQTGIFFLEGTGDGFFNWNKKSSLLPLTGSDKAVNGKYFSSTIHDTSLGIVMILSGELYFGSSSGELIPILSNKLKLPSLIKANSFIIGDNYILQADGLCICINLNGPNPSQFSNYSFTSICKVGSSYFGTSSSGLFKLWTGDKDNDEIIEAFFELGITDFNLNKIKKLRKAVIGFEADGRLEISFNVDEGGWVTTEVIPNNTDKKQHFKEVSGKQELQGRYFSLKVNNIFGSYFAIDSIDSYFYLSSKKVKGY